MTSPIKETNTIKVLLADDHHLVRNGIKLLLDKYEDIEVVGEGANGQNILNELEKYGDDIDLVIADINMPEIDGLELTTRLKKDYPGIKVIILSMLDHEKYLTLAFKAGVDAYLLKSINKEELLFAIRQVAGGSFYLCTELSHQLLKKSLWSWSTSQQHLNTDIEFSEREIEILNLIAEGYTNVEIAEKLFTSKRTVEGHRLQMISKTGVRNTAALIKFCLTNGILI